MKKVILILLVLSLAFMGMACGSAPAAAPAPVVANTPDWLNDFPPDDVLWGIGSAKLSDTDQAMTFAEASARSSIARQINTMAQQMLTDYFLQAGGGENPATTALKENVQRQLVNANVSGARPIKRTQTPDGRWWYLVEFKKSDAKTTVASLLGNEEASYAQFKAQQALQMMDAQLAKNEKPLVVDYN